MATRKPLTLDLEGHQFVTRFLHPVLCNAKGRPLTVRVPFGRVTREDAEKALRALNAVFLNPDNWANPPADTPPLVLKAWGIRPTQYADATPAMPVAAVDGPPLLEVTEPSPIDLADRADGFKTSRLLTRYEIRLEREYRILNGKYFAALRKIESLEGRSAWPGGVSPTLGAAAADWLAGYKGRDPQQIVAVTGVINRFVAHFQPHTELAAMQNLERDINAWLWALTKKVKGQPAKPISAKRRREVRKYILKFLRESGLRTLATGKGGIEAVTAKDVRAGRGAIRWLEKTQADAVAKALPAYWADVFRFQCGTGLRSDELPTLQKANFSPDFSTVTLAPVAHLTLKNGGRTVQVPPAVRKIVARRFTDPTLTILFPNPVTGKLWQPVTKYNRLYRAALRAAGKAVGVQFTMCCRVGRRTCASLLLRAGTPIAKVAALLGDDPKTVQEHYAAIIPHEVDTSPATLAAGE